MGTNLTYLQVVAIAFFALEYRTVKCHAVLSRNFEHALGAIFRPFDLQTCRPMEANMGGLVLTKGTRHLIKHFQKEFKGNRLDDLRNAVIDGTPTKIKDVFANGNVDLLWLTNNVKHGHSQRQNPADKKCLLPDDNSGGQPHLEARWIYFLTASNNNVLTRTNHQKIRWLISTVLNDPSYGYIDFDCIECDPQSVFYADEFDNGGAKYLRIVLGTPPMDKLPNTNLSLDPQPGYTGNAPTLGAADGNGGAAQGQNSNATQNPDPKPTQD